jgi:EAL domain-containing protein (putative c-di-GMP-specific phosphodiesterase class I)
MFAGREKSDVMACADVAMYEAKQAGRSRYVVYQSGPTGPAHETARHSETARIRRAIENDAFSLYCQPILELASGEITQHELLLRIPGEDGGEPLPPSSFLYVAERVGSIVAVDSWVVRSAVGLVAAHARSGRRLVLNVNLSSKSIGSSGFLGVLEDELSGGAIDPACLVFEITETTVIANLEETRTFAERLRRLGCRLALDDFGAGFASFYFLKNFPLDYIKIDGEFVRGLSASVVDQLVVQGIVGIAKGMNKKTMAEHVGCAEDARFLGEHGVDYAQGYYIGQPRPVTEVLPLID